MTTRARLGALMIVGLPLLGGCGLKDYLPDPAAEAKKAQDEAAAIGGACRQAGRSLEDCFDRQSKVEKSGALRGWREMDEYMRENKIEAQVQKEEPAKKEPSGKDAKAKSESKDSGEE